MTKLSIISAWIRKNWNVIPDKFKENLKPSRYSNIDGLKEEGHIVVLIIDRQKPSVGSCYDFDEERIGINRFGQVIWGFDSGCSCPTPWDDSYPNCYNVEKNWKQFEVNLDKFDRDLEKDATLKFEKIKKSLSELKQEHKAPET